MAFMVEMIANRGVEENFLTFLPIDA